MKPSATLQNSRIHTRCVQAAEKNTRFSFFLFSPSFLYGCFFLSLRSLTRKISLFVPSRGSSSLVAVFHRAIMPGETVRIIRGCLFLAVLPSPSSFQPVAGAPAKGKRSKSGPRAPASASLVNRAPIGEQLSQHQTCCAPFIATV